MFRRLAATLLAVLVLAVVSATPAVAKSTKDKGGDSGPVATAPGPQDPGGSTGSGTSTGSGGTGTSTGGTAGSTPPGPAGGGTTTTGSDKSKDPSTRTDTPKRKKSADPSPHPASTTSSTTTSTAGTAPASSVDRSAVRASAAPVATNTGITALLPAPDPMLLPDSTTNATAPVDAERPSGLPQALLAVLVGVGVLSVALLGTFLARRRGIHSRA